MYLELLLEKLEALVEPLLFDPLRLEGSGFRLGGGRTKQMAEPSRVCTGAMTIPSAASLESTCGSPIGMLIFRRKFVNFEAGKSLEW
jgi:hypothetical protein